MKRKKRRKHSALFLRTQKVRQEKWLAAYRRLGRQNAACDETGISHDSIWDWRETDPKFEAAFLRADESIGVLLEDEAIRRAVKGIERGVYYEGKRVDNELEFSDTLLKVALVARNRRYKAAAEEAQASAVPVVHVITYGNANPNQTPTGNTPTQLPPAPVSTPHIKSYR